MLKKICKKYVQSYLRGEVPQGLLDIQFGEVLPQSDYLRMRAPLS